MRGQRLAIGLAFELAIAGQTGGEARFARAHRVALAGNGERRRPGPADLPGDERQVVDGVDRLGALRTVVDAHRPADDRGARPAVEPGGLVELLGGQPGNPRHVRGRIAANRFAQRVEAGGVRGDVVAIDQVRLDEDVDQAVDEREIRAGLQRQVQIRAHGRLGHARIDHDQVLSPLRSSRCQRMGWLSAIFAPIRRMTSARSKSSYAPGGPSLPKERL